MKRLTKDERTGATALVLVALVVCLGSIILSRRNRTEPAPEELVKTIILASDSLNKGNEDGENVGNLRKDKERKRGRVRENSKKKERKQSGGKEKKEKKSPASARDFLNDPV